MINNYCKKCNVEIETSECSICGERAEVKSQLYWCEKCNVPLYDEKCCICGKVGKKSTTDIRPVFPEERLLLEASLETFSKHGIEQLKGAFNYAKDGDYSGFSRNSRNEFALFVMHWLNDNNIKFD